MKTWRDDIICKKSGQIEIGNIWSINSNLSLIAEEIIEATKQFDYNFIAGIETKGLIVASALSSKLKMPLVVFRKKGKILYTESKYQEEYINWRNKSDGIEIERNQLNKNMKLLVVDDLSQTLETFNAVFRITKKSETTISAYVCLANISETKVLNGIKIISLLQEEEI